MHVPNFEGVSGSADRGGGDNSIQFINIERVGNRGENPAIGQFLRGSLP